MVMVVKEQAWGLGWGWRDEFRFERAETDMPVGHLEIPRWH